ncbi:MAG: hypothetical protein ABFC73_03445 [Clostridiaceae bacterium]
MIGKCALCGCEAEMTFEHIPPRSCFNSAPAKSVTGNEIIASLSNHHRNPWDVKGLPYGNQQRGMGCSVLCAKCNSSTGKWYGESYASLVHSVHKVIRENEIHVPSMLDFFIKGVYPLRIVKQILSMTCSINYPYYEDDRFRKLADFVLEKNASGIDKESFRIYLYIAYNHQIKYWPLTVLIKKIPGNDEYIPDTVSEIFAYPLGFVVCFNPNPQIGHPGIDITSFCDFKYGQMCNLDFSVPVLESNSVSPCDYRSKKEIIVRMIAEKSGDAE